MGNDDMNGKSEDRLMYRMAKCRIFGSHSFLCQMQKSFSFPYICTSLSEMTLKWKKVFHHWNAIIIQQTIADLVNFIKRRSKQNNKMYQTIREAEQSS
uniref:Uncharacterized protein n=1 Tax=Strigamia maritima TaxID=126957 RepID=T1JAJ2_STRMM